MEWHRKFMHDKVIQYYNDMIFELLLIAPVKYILGPAGLIRFIEGDDAASVLIRKLEKERMQYINSEYPTITSPICPSTP